MSISSFVTLVAITLIGLEGIASECEMPVSALLKEAPLNSLPALGLEPDRDGLRPSSSEMIHPICH